MENQTIIELVLDMEENVLHRLRRLLAVELHDDPAPVRLEHDSGRHVADIGRKRRLGCRRLLTSALPAASAACHEQRQREE